MAAPFLKREIAEYESELGPKLLLINDAPLSKDKREIFDSPEGIRYLTEVFKSKFKSAETHVTYINSNTDVDFVRCMLFNILSHYMSKQTIDTKNLVIGFVGQKSLDAFREEYLSVPDSNGVSVSLNEHSKVIRLYAAVWVEWFAKHGKKCEDIVLPYVVLPDVTEDHQNIKEILNEVSFAKDLKASPYNTVDQLITKLKFILNLYEDKALNYFSFSGKIDVTNKRIEYFKVYDEFTKMSILYCPTDVESCETTPAKTQEMKTLLGKVLTTVPVTGENIHDIVPLFGFKNQIKIVSNEDLPAANGQDKKFEIIGDLNGTPSEWYSKWYHDVFLPTLKKQMGNTTAEKEGYNMPLKYEWVYDIEVFKEDWLFVAKTLDGKNRLICWNDEEQLAAWVKNKILIGFNNAAYDDVVIRHAMVHKHSLDMNTPNVKQYSDTLIMHDGNPIYPTLPKNFKRPNFLSWDVSFHGPFDIRRNSLKKLTMSVLNKRNYDSEVSFDIDRKLTLKERADVEKYCEMDVDNTLALFLQDPDNPKRTFAKESYDIRWNMIIEYGMKAKTLINKSSSFAGKLLCGEDAVADKNNTCKIVDGKKQYYSIPEMAMKELAGTEVLEFYLKHQSNPDYIHEKIEVYMGGNDDSHKYQFGFGGLHQALLNYGSKNLVNMDVASLYPSLLVQYGLMSRGASKNPESYKDVYHTRLAAKREGKKLLNEGLKLILNGAIGAMLSEFNPLYDTWSNSSICVHGQLLLFILAKRLFDAGFNIVQTNTDGIMIERQDNVDYMPICEEWMEQTRLVLEFDEIAILQQNNVNNYYCEFTNGKVKSKGFYKSNEKFGIATSKILCNMVTEKPLLEGVEPRDFVIFKKHAIGEIYDGVTKQKLEGRSLAFVAGYASDPRTQSYYSRSKNTRKVPRKDEDGNPVLDETGKPIVDLVNTESKITGFNDYMLLVDDINTLTLEEIDTKVYTAFARNLLDQADEFGPYFTADLEKQEEPCMLQALNAFKDNTDDHPRNNNVYCQNFLFECDYLSKEEQEELIERNKDIIYRAVWSGNRSYHCIVRLSKPVTVTQYKKLWYYLRYKYNWGEADEQAGLPSKYTRVPNQMNEKTGEMQTLYYNGKHVLDADELLEALPKLKDEVKAPKLYTGELSIKALERHIKKLNWDSGNRYASVQKLSPRLISQVSLSDLLDMIPDGKSLEKDHLYVIRSKYKYYERHKDELENSAE